LTGEVLGQLLRRRATASRVSASIELLAVNVNGQNFPVRARNESDTSPWRRKPIPKCIAHFTPLVR
jgi:hypothetical protein